MDERKAHLLLICLVIVELYILVVEVLFLYLHLNYGIGIYFLIGALLILLYLMWISCSQPVSEEEKSKILKTYDIIRLDIGLIIVCFSIILTLPFRILFPNGSNIPSDLFALVLSLYFAGVAIIIDGIRPSKQDLVPIEEQISGLKKKMEELTDKQNEILNKLDSR